MSEWQKHKLGELCTRITVGHVGSMASRYTQSGIPFLRSQNIKRGRIDLSSVKYIDEEFHHELAKSQLRPGDLAIVRTGDPGKTALIPDGLGPLNCSDIVIATPRPEVDARFLCYAINETAQDFVKAHTVGAVQQHFNVKSASRLEIHVPKLAHQRAISELLGALDNKITVNDRIAAAVDDLASSYFEAAFSPALDHVSDGTPLPTDWTVSTVGESTITVESGSRPKGGVTQYTSGVPSIGAESIIGLGKFDFSKTKFIPKEFFERMRRGVVQDRDILVYKDGGKPGDFKPHVTLFGEGFPFSVMSINEHVYRVRMTTDIGQNFGYYWLSSAPIMAEMRRRATGVAIPGMNSTAFKGIPFIIPPFQEIVSFTDFAAPLVNKALTAAVESRTLSALRDTLLPQLMSGRLRVKDAEKIVEDHV
jgi:type I restriction enzyme S subunit